MDKQIAIDISQNALLYIIEKEEEFYKFIDISGTDINNIRNNFSNEIFLSSVLEYIMSWEPLLLKISQERSIEGEDFQKAFIALGGKLMNY
ncbi:MAG: DUF3572 family protein [Alphaproteobacteria bacterium]|nr:DUF3572 family protein [Alphaproteobacteria bacterium]